MEDIAAPGHSSSNIFCVQDRISERMQKNGGEKPGIDQTIS